MSPNREQHGKKHEFTVVVRNFKNLLSKIDRLSRQVWAQNNSTAPSVSWIEQASMNYSSQQQNALSSQLHKDNSSSHGGATHL